MCLIPGGSRTCIWVPETSRSVVSVNSRPVSLRECTSALLQLTSCPWGLLVPPGTCGSAPRSVLLNHLVLSPSSRCPVERNQLLLLSGLAEHWAPRSPSALQLLRLPTASRGTGLPPGQRGFTWASVVCTSLFRTLTWLCWCERMPCRREGIASSFPASAWLSVCRSEERAVALGGGFNSQTYCGRP